MGRLLPRTAHVALVLMALASLFALGTDVTNYIAAIKSVRGLSLELAEVQVIDDDNPRAVVHFRVKNDSPLPIYLERYFFELYLNGELIGTSYSTYVGTDPDADPVKHQTAQNIERTLQAGETLDLTYTVYVYSAQMEIVRTAQRADPLAWRTTATFNALLANSREKMVIRLRAESKE